MRLPSVERIITHSLRKYTKAEGEIFSNPVAVPDSAIFLQVELTRDSLPESANEVVRARVEISMDGGVVWSPSPAKNQLWLWGVFPVSFGALGGEARNRMGEIDGTSAVYNILLPRGTNRWVRAALIPLDDVQVSMQAFFTEVKA